MKLFILVGIAIPCYVWTAWPSASVGLYARGALCWRLFV